MYSAYFGEGINSYVSNFYCYGNESQLTDCQYSTTTCSRSFTAGVQCLGDVISGQALKLPYYILLYSNNEFSDLCITKCTVAKLMQEQTNDALEESL